MRYCKIIITSALVIALIFSFTLSPVAHAEPLTTAIVGAAAAAAFVAWGISITAAQATGQGMQHFFTNEITSYIGTSSLANVFGETVGYTAGVVTLSEKTYNAIIDFKDYLVDKYGLSESNSTIQEGKWGSTWLDQQLPAPGVGGIGVSFSTYEAGDQSRPYPGYRWVQAYWNNGNAIFSGSGKQAGARYRFTGGATTDDIKSGTSVSIGLVFGLIDMYNGSLSTVRYGISTITTSDIKENMQWSESPDYVEPTSIPNTKAYQITIDNPVTTDLESYIEDVYDKVSDNDLISTGEVIDIAPAPTPQPVPTFPPPPPPIPAPQDPTIPISDATSGEVNSWIAGIGDTINGVIDGIEATFDSINTGILEGINSINQKLSDILSAISGAIDQALNDIKNAIGSLAGWLEDILEYLQSLGLSITDALDALLDLISDLAIEIENIAEAVIEADRQWFNDLIDAILNPFMPWINQLASGVGIWHYVVEWLQCIHEPFVFFWCVLTALGPCFPKPIYAVAAACIVIAIYKRFGR